MRHFVWYLVKRYDVETLLIDKVLNKEHLYEKIHVENVHQKLIPDPFLILVNNPKQYVVECHPYVTRMYSYVIRMSLLCTCMSSVCRSYVLVCYPYVTRTSSVCHPHVTRMWFYHEPITIASSCYATLQDRATWENQK